MLQQVAAPAFRCCCGSALGAGSARVVVHGPHAQARHAVAHLTQAQAQAGACRGPVVAKALERPFENFALHLIKIGGQVGRQRSFGCDRRCECGYGRGRPSRCSVGLHRRALIDPIVGQIEIAPRDELCARQRQRAVQQVLEFPHVARKNIALQKLQRIGRQGGHRRDAGVGRCA